jgi:hypothetical protein
MKQNKKVVGIYFYDILPEDADYAISHGIKKLKSGKWGIYKYEDSSRTFTRKKIMADQIFGTGKFIGEATPTTPTSPTTPTTGKISAVTSTEVDIKNPDGTTLKVPTNTGMLSKDANGKLVLNKQAVQAKQTPQQQPIQAGQDVQINNSLDLNIIKQLSGLA